MYYKLPIKEFVIVNLVYVKKTFNPPYFIKPILLFSCLTIKKTSIKNESGLKCFQ